MQKVSKLARSHIEALKYRQTIETAVLDCENAKNVDARSLHSLAHRYTSDAGGGGGGIGNFPHNAISEFCRYM